MKRALRKFFGLTLAIALTAGALTACGDGGVGASGSPSSDPSSSAPVAAADSMTIRIGISGTPDLDPAVANTNSSLMAAANLYDGLVFPTADGVEARLAENWNISDDGLTYTFTLRQGVKFHSGTELKASDVKFSMERMLAIGEGYAYLFTDVIDSVEATGDYEVVFHLKEAYGPFLNALVRFFVVSEEAIMANIDTSGPYGDFGDYGKNWLVTNDAGTGAYAAKELVQQDFFLAEKYDDWFLGWEGRDNAPTSFRLLAVSEPATVRTMMSNKEMEMTDQWQSAENLNAMAGFEGVDIANYSTYLMYNMYLNTQKAPMDDINFRRGVASLFDYASITNDIFIDSVNATSPVAAGVAGHVDTAVMSYDIEKAKEYFSQSAYADTLADYPLEMLVNSDVADLEKVALLFQASAGQVGITVEISKAPWVSIIDRVATAESTPHMLAINSAPAINEAGIYLQTRYSSDTMGTWENCEWLGDTALDTMMADAMKIVDDNERYAAYADIQNYLVDELYPTVYMCDLTERVAYQNSYVNWPFVEEYSGNGVASSLIGFSHMIYDMEIFPDQK